MGRYFHVSILKCCSRGIQCEKEVVQHDKFVWIQALIVNCFLCYEKKRVFYHIHTNFDRFNLSCVASIICKHLNLLYKTHVKMRVAGEGWQNGAAHGHGDFLFISAWLSVFLVVGLLLFSTHHKSFSFFLRRCLHRCWTNIIFFSFFMTTDNDDDLSFHFFF